MICSNLSATSSIGRS